MTNFLSFYFLSNNSVESGFRSSLLLSSYFKGLIFLCALSIGINDVHATYSKEYKVKKNPDEKPYIKDQDDEKYKHKEPTAKTQINEKTDLFDKSVDNWSGFQAELEVGRFKPEKGSEAHLDFMDDGGMGAARSQGDSLSSIKASELDDKGRRELAEFRSSFGDEGDIYVDYSRALNKQLYEDAESIADGQDELLGALIGELKKVGVDCKTIKGPKVVEPEYYLQIKKEQYKDAVYNQTMCEELRGRYNCTDSMSITCLQRGWSHPWDPDTKEIKFTYGEIRARGWLGDEYWYSEEEWFGKKLNFYKQKFFGSHESVKKEIVTRLGVKDGNVEMVRINRDGNGWLNDLGSRHYSWNDFSAFYRYRPGEVVCDKWSEERWDESCQQAR